MNEAPLLLLIFNRPDYTQKLFDVIATVKPKNLYIASDGPRKEHPEDVILVNKTRAIFDNINWECSVRKLYREENLSCGPAVSSAITWFFDHEEQGIILEDDCIPSISFFQFCNILLEKYKLNDNVMMIGGYSLFTKDILKNNNESYFFTNIKTIWGWATWKRAWNKYRLEINDDMISKAENNKVWTELKYKTIRKSKKDILLATYKGLVNTWDIQWDYCISVNNGICILPFVNLISNIGEFGTNYSPSNFNINNKRYEIDTVNLIHTKEIRVNERTDAIYQKILNDKLSKINEPLVQFAINKMKFYILKVLRSVGIYDYLKKAK
ncbi:MAG: hypothetical protein U0T69_07035 [Chitinophagales bacterium]